MPPISTDKPTKIPRNTSQKHYWKRYLSSDRTDSPIFITEYLPPTAARTSSKSEKDLLLFLRLDWQIQGLAVEKYIQKLCGFSSTLPLVGFVDGESKTKTGCGSPVLTVDSPVFKRGQPALSGTCGWTVGSRRRSCWVYHESRPWWKRADYPPAPITA